MLNIKNKKGILFTIPFTLGTMIVLGVIVIAILIFTGTIVMNLLSPNFLGGAIAVLGIVIVLVGLKSPDPYTKPIGAGIFLVGVFVFFIGLLGANFGYLSIGGEPGNWIETNIDCEVKEDCIDWLESQDMTPEMINENLDKIKCQENICHIIED
jgi:hypothetical protein